MFGNEGENNDAGDDDDEVEVAAVRDEPPAGRCVKKMEVGTVVGEEIVPNEPN